MTSDKRRKRISQEEDKHWWAGLSRRGNSQQTGGGVSESHTTTPEKEGEMRENRERSSRWERATVNTWRTSAFQNPYLT